MFHEVMTELNRRPKDAYTHVDKPVEGGGVLREVFLAADQMLVAKFILDRNDYMVEVLYPNFTLH